MAACRWWLTDQHNGSRRPGEIETSVAVLTVAMLTRLARAANPHEY